MPEVGAPQPLGQQDLDRPAEQLLARVAEEREGLGVDEDNACLLYTSPSPRD